MIINTEVTAEIETIFGKRYISINQNDDLIVVDVNKAAQLIEALQKLLAGEEVE